jgi:hypothetical protein
MAFLEWNTQSCFTSHCMIVVCTLWNRRMDNEKKLDVGVFNFLPQPTFLRLINRELIILCRPGSSVGVVTGYGLDGPGIQSRLGGDFPHLSRPALGPTQPPVQWVPCLSLG